MADAKFYDVPWARGSRLLDDEFPSPAGLVEAGWQRRAMGAWTLYSPDVQVAAQGWKVHVAALPGDAAQVIGACWLACRDLGVPFKTLRSRSLVLASQLKYACLTASGKVITCYPAPAQLEPLVARLATALGDRPAPRVLAEVGVPGAPVYLRYGAFVASWATGSDGRAVPGLQRGHRVVPDVRGRRAPEPGTEEPELVRRLRSASSTADASVTLDISDVAVLHRSNAGGVYRARRPDGAVVLLKEARRHTGLDLAGVEARARLRHEHAALQRLSGSGVTPEPLDYLTLGDSEFLIMEWVPGGTILESLSRRHPLVNPALGPADVPNYLAWADRVGRAAAAALGALHARGVVHRDVQPANVIDGGDRVVLIDLESSLIDGVGVSKGVATPGFSIPGDTDGPAADLRSVGRVRALLINPLTPLLHHRPELEAELDRVGRADLAGLGADGGERSAAPDPAALVAGIAASATPERDDRLFPGDVEQFSAPRAGLGLLHGAAGVLLTLHRGGWPVEPDWVGWLADRAVRPGACPRGLGGGADGIALALAELGDLKSAGQVADRFLLGAGPPPADVPWWQHGLAGTAIAAARLGRALDRRDLMAQAESAVERISRLLDDAGAPPGFCPGLLSGWGGVASTLASLADVFGADRVVPLAMSAVRREAAACAVSGPALLGRDGALLLPYVGRGSAGLGLAAGALRGLVGIAADERSELDALITGVRASCAQPLSVFGGLLSGRGGLICVLDALTAGRHPMIAEHRRRLAWQVVPDPSGTVSLGDYNLRCSTDLASGSAGLLLALHPEAGSQLWQGVTFVSAKS